MRFLSTAVALVSLCIGTWAIHESDVGVVDWHKHLVGVPLYGSTSTAPSFHIIGNRSLILSGTSSNVIAALDPEDGSIGAWSVFRTRSGDGDCFYSLEVCL